jgi:hypothetical protein
MKSGPGAPLPLDGWVSYNPIRGEPASQRTDVWIAYDESAIYFAFKCFDTDPARIRTTISRRDSAWSDDWIAGSLFENPEAGSYAATARAFFFKVSYLARF